MKDKLINTAKYQDYSLKNDQNHPQIKTVEGRIYVYLGEATKEYAPYARFKMALRAIMETFYTFGVGPFVSDKIQDHWMAAFTGKRKIDVYSDDAETLIYSNALNEAAKKGDIQAAKTLWLVHEELPFSGPEPVFKYLKMVADSGDPEAQALLGDKYLTGEGVEKNEEEAYKYFIKSAEAEIDYSRLRAAYAYANGIGVDEDANKAYVYLDKISDPELLSEAQFEMGLLIQKGNIAGKTPLDAVPLFEKASKNGNEEASRYLGSLYAFGQHDALKTQGNKAKEEECLKSDFEKAKFFLELAVEQGDKLAITPLGWLAAAQKNYKLAQEKFEEAAKAGDNSADYWHAMLYVDRKLKAENSKEIIIELLTKSAEAGYPSANYDLAIIYLDGDPIFKEKGINYLKKAASLGHLAAQEIIAKHQANSIPS